MEPQWVIRYVLALRITRTQVNHQLGGLTDILGALLDGLIGLELGLPLFCIQVNAGQGQAGGAAELLLEAIQEAAYHFIGRLGGIIDFFPAADQADTHNGAGYGAAHIPAACHTAAETCGDLRDDLRIDVVCFCQRHQYAFCTVITGIEKVHGVLRLRIVHDVLHCKYIDNLPCFTLYGNQVWVTSRCQGELEIGFREISGVPFMDKTKTEADKLNLYH